MRGPTKGSSKLIFTVCMVENNHVCEDKHIAQWRGNRSMLLGEVHDSKTALADKAYDSNDIRNAIVAEGMAAVIPSRRSRP